MNTYQTTDLHLAAFLIARRHKLVEIGAQKHGRFTFPPEAADDAPKFFTNELVGARDFAAALRQLKSALYALKR
jgi:hypothetical protein